MHKNLGLLLLRKEQEVRMLRHLLGYNGRVFYHRSHCTYQTIFIQHCIRICQWGTLMNVGYSSEAIPGKVRYSIVL